MVQTAIRSPSRRGRVAAAALAVCCQLWSKPEYGNGAYAERRGSAPNCARCHLNPENPPGFALNFSAAGASVDPGGVLNVTVENPSRLERNSLPGLALHGLPDSGEGRFVPADFGWQVLGDPSGGRFNYVRMASVPQARYSWTLRAPNGPGRYILAASAYISLRDSNGLATVRTKGAFEVEVRAPYDFDPPQVLKVVQRWGNYVYVKFSEPVDPASAAEPSNYRLRERLVGSERYPSRVYLSRDGTVVRLTTLSHRVGGVYSLVIRNLRDRSTRRNQLDSAEYPYAPDFETPFRLYAEWMQEVNDAFAFFSGFYPGLGKGVFTETAAYSRLVLVLPLAGDPLEMPPYLNVASARLRLRQYGTRFPAAAVQDWKAVPLLGERGIEGLVGNRMLDSAGKEVSHAFLWNGGNPQGDRAATMSRAVPEVEEGEPETWWEWDVTDAFLAARAARDIEAVYPDEFILRLSAVNESPASGGPVFYGADAEQMDSRPHLLLEIPPPDTVPGAAGLRPGPGADPRGRQWTGPPRLRILPRVKGRGWRVLVEGNGSWNGRGVDGRRLLPP